MRTFSRTALLSCNIRLLPNQRYVSVRLLTGDIFHFVSELKGRCKTIFEQVCNYLGLNDAELFGLAIKYDNEYLFVEPPSKLYKYAPKLWKSQDSGLDDCGKPLLMFYLRVQLYVDCQLLISDKVARLHYYLQIKENVSNYSLPLSDERAFLLAAFALQADLGNYNDEKSIGQYFDPSKYFPLSIIRKLGEHYVLEHTPALHRDNMGLSRGEAQVGFIKEASDSSAPHNLHFYKMKRKKGKIEDFVWLAISHKSVQIFEDNGLSKFRLTSFPWADITKIHFEKKKFQIRCVGCQDIRKFTYYLKNEEISKSLLWLCRIMHQFSMVVQPKVVELEKMELEASIPFRESYIYSDANELNWERARSSSKASGITSRLHQKTADRFENGQRISVVSNSSSNTTSGIVSDKVHSSLYESEDDLEIMISSPPQNDHFTGSSVDNLDSFHSSNKPRSASGEWSSYKQLQTENGLIPNTIKTATPNSVLERKKLSRLEYPECSKLISPKLSIVDSKISLNSKSSDAKSDSFTFLVPKPVCGTYPKISNESKREKHHYSDEKRNTSIKSWFGAPDLNSSNNDKVSKQTQLAAQRNSVCGVPYADCDSIITDYSLGVETLNSKNNNHHRNATRIGVSSLTKGRTQRLPLAIYSNRQAGSEPELNHLRSWSSTYSTDSEHSLPASMFPAYCYSNGYKKNTAESNLVFGSCTSISTMSSAFSATNTGTLKNMNGGLDQDGFSTMNYPAIPPPLAYCSVEDSNNNLGCKLEKSNSNIDQAANTDPVEPSVIPDKSQLDIEQLWKKSHDMELPLLTALCNDRSLMMLPKTVPTCSRQRHVGASKDIRRFSCSSMLTTFEEKNIINNNISSTGPTLSSQTLGGKLSNWHNDVEYYKWLNHITNSNNEKMALPLSISKTEVPSFRPHSYSAPSEIAFEALNLTQTVPFTKINTTGKRCNGTVA